MEAFPDGLRQPVSRQAFKKWVSDAAWRAEMAPKKNTIPATALPQEEELVELPEGSPDVPDPPFTFVIAHLFSHIFSLETCA